MKPFNSIKPGLKSFTTPLALCLSALSFISPAPAYGHGDDDHGASEQAPVTNPNAGSNRLNLSGDNTEVVAIYQDGRLQLFVDDWASNTPIEQAEISVEWQGETVQAFAQQPGQYLTPPLSTPAHDSVALTLSIQAADRAELLAGQMHLPERTPEAHTHRSFSTTHVLLAATLALLAGVGTGFYFANRAQKRRLPLAVLAAVVLASTVLPAPPVFAHGDDTHEEPATAQTLLNSSEEKAARLADGSLFVPKRVQHLLQVRTLRADFAQQAFTAKLPASIALDNSQHSEVRAPFAGQINSPGQIKSAGQHFAQPGQRVQKNAVVMTMQAQFSAAESAQLSASIAKAKLEWNAAEQRYQRSANLVGSLSTQELARIKLDRDSAQAEYLSLRASLQQQTPIRAPQTGVISQLSVAPGSRVESGTLLFTVLADSRSVIAYAPPDFQISARLGAQTGQSKARLSAGQRQAELQFIGADHALQDQQLPLYFRFDDKKAEFAIGESAQVLVETDQIQNGVRLPAAAIVRADDGGKALFVKIAAEQFQLRPTHVQGLASGEVLVLSGIKAGERIVSDGAAMLAQLR